MMFVMLCAIGASAEKKQMDLTSLNTGWESIYDSTTKTITFEGGWKGRGWWFGDTSESGALDASRYSQFVLEFEATKTKVAVQVVYTALKEGSTDHISTYADAEAGNTSIVVNLDENLKNGIQQIYIQTDAAGTVTLKDAYLKNNGPEFTLQDANLECAGIGTENASIASEELTKYPDNAVVSLVGTVSGADKYGYGMGKIRDNSWSELKSLGQWKEAETTTFTLTVGELKTYVQSDGNVYIQIWDGTFTSAYVTINIATVSVSAAKIGTMMLPFDAEVPEGARVYTADTYDNSGVIRLKSVDAIAANTPYIIRSEQNVYTFSGVANAEEFSYTDNCLTGTYEDVAAPVGSYVLQNGNEGAGFYRVVEGEEPTVKAGHAYITLPIAENAPQLVLSFNDGETTGVTELHNKNTAAKTGTYNLAGMRVDDNAKGFVVKNGKKYIVK